MDAREAKSSREQGEHAFGSGRSKLILVALSIK